MWLLYKGLFAAILTFFFTLARADEVAPIRVGVVPFDPPYIITLNQGFEVDLIHLICKKINRSCQLLPMRYQELFLKLINHEIDVAMDGLDYYIQPNPLNGPFIYSLPYLLSQGQLIVQKNNSVSTIEEMPPKARVGLVRERTERGEGIFYSFFKNKFGNTYTLKQFSGIDDLVNALNLGQISAAFLDNNEANYWILNGNFKPLGAPMKVADGVGIAALPENKALIEQINQQLQQIEGSPTYKQLYTTYIGM